MKKKLGRPAKYETDQQWKDAKNASSKRSRDKMIAKMTPAEYVLYKKKRSESSMLSRNKRLSKMTPAERINFRRKDNHPTEIIPQLLKKISHSRFRAKKFGLPFTLTLDDAVNIFYYQDGKCAKSGKKLTIGIPNCGDNISFDQIIPGDGYIPENIQFLTADHNIAKNDSSDTEYDNDCKDVVVNNMIHHMTEKQITDFFCDILKQKHKLSCV